MATGKTGNANSYVGDFYYDWYYDKNNTSPYPQFQYPTLQVATTGMIMGDPYVVYNPSSFIYTQSGLLEAIPTISAKGIKKELLVPMFMLLVDIITKRHKAMNNYNVYVCPTCRKQHYSVYDTPVYIGFTESLLERLKVDQSFSRIASEILRCIFKECTECREALELANGNFHALCR